VYATVINLCKKVEIKNLITFAAARKNMLEKFNEISKSKKQDRT